MPQSGIERMREWFIDQTWEQVYQAESAHLKAEYFQTLLVDKLNEIFPEQIRKINNDDQPWISMKLKKLDRKRKRIFHKQRRSEKWKKWDKIFKKEVKSAKSDFYKNKVADLKTKKPGQWYSCLKRITSHDQHKNDQPSVGEISHLSDQKLVELIADQFAKIQNEYQPLENDDVSVPPFSESDVPKFTPAQVWFTLIKINTNKSTVSGDFPAKLIKLFAAYIAEPFTDILNTSVGRGEYPKIYKFEISTPVPKSFPTDNLTQLRNISGLLNFDKLMEKLLAELMVKDMAAKLDPSQYGNQKGISIQHYLINMVHRILTVLDNNSRK